ncbi:hypothetical protein J3R82DRAFT_9152 [Butyriboletus roseoflavus]|nr:hypothetical protein J3R82DRAFT_9152 [Butyriboletus roseoflavus]
MARAQRVAIYASAFFLVYLLAFFAVLPVPLLEPDIVPQLLRKPVVFGIRIELTFESTLV